MSSNSSQPNTYNSQIWDLHRTGQQRYLIADYLLSQYIWTRIFCSFLPVSLWCWNSDPNKYWIDSPFLVISVWCYESTRTPCLGIPLPQWRSYRRHSSPLVLDLFELGMTSLFARARWTTGYWFRPPRTTPSWRTIFVSETSSLVKKIQLISGRFCSGLDICSICSATDDLIPVGWLSCTLPVHTTSHGSRNSPSQRTTIRSC